MRRVRRLSGILMTLTLLPACGNADGRQADDAGPDRMTAETVAGGDGATRRTSTGEPSSAARAGEESYVVLRQVRVMDRHGFGQPVEALRMLVPSGWDFQGQVQWNSAGIQCPYNVVQLSLRASSADGSTGFELFPDYTWQWSEDPTARRMLRQSQQMYGTGGCEMAPPVGAAQFVEESLIPSVRRGAQVVRSEPLPEAARAHHRAVRQQLAAAGMANVQGAELQADAARVLIRRESREEWIVGTVRHMAMASPSMSRMMGYGGQAYARSFTSTATNLYAVYAPAGQIESNRDLFATLLATVQLNPRWLAAVNQVMVNLGSIQTAGAAARSRIWTRTAREISDIQMQAYEQQQAVQDAMAEQFSQTIRGVETFHDPQTGESWELPGGYPEVWTNGSGEFVLSETVGLDPNTIFTRSSWRQLGR